MQNYNDLLLTALEKDLAYYDRIFLIAMEERADKEMFNQFCVSEALKNCGKKILLLSTENPAEENHALCRKISSQMALQLNKLYHMYEFSDRFQLFSREKCFGGIFNFVDMGILTKEEAFSALLA